MRLRDETLLPKEVRRLFVRVRLAIAAAFLLAVCSASICNGLYERRPWGAASASENRP